MILPILGCNAVQLVIISLVCSLNYGTELECTIGLYISVYWFMCTNLRCVSHSCCCDDRWRWLLTSDFVVRNAKAKECKRKKIHHSWQCAHPCALCFPRSFHTIRIIPLLLCHLFIGAFLLRIINYYSKNNGILSLLLGWDRDIFERLDNGSPRTRSPSTSQNNTIIVRPGWLAARFHNE